MMFGIISEAFRSIFSFLLVISFSFFAVSLFMIMGSVLPKSKITVGTAGGGNTSTKNALLLTVGTFISGAISLIMLYFSK
ncbi:MAG: hypothetical protein UW79_C0020G0012 [Candidatus Yanofskybacteria bacterium GW2011_GWA2_44_9]|uniref:Uncharacterized protein n=1 Tax=Candidatus Yanofskybacteria bacterium GW2011_GWA2_44_9 TaxID=1619025 RepID=A0A0G1KCT1_9BACT|nr:MAG: hypothetical protein UW79_C0020G0012 [Candidatus Yanofskybacteria bacterium GW2011_GWA2_44_9]